jgi:hypothetical protein
MKLTETDTTFTLTGFCECDSCNGTGLYCGMAERKGSAVVCSTCKGTGKVEFKGTFKKFKTRKRRSGIKRVFETAGGYGICGEDVTTTEGVTIHFSRFGASYDDWLNGEKPAPIEELHCPYQHTGQELQSDDVNNLYKTRCDKGLSLGGMITNCKCRKDMAKCWRIYKGQE